MREISNALAKSECINLFKKAGIQKGDEIMLHASLSKMGEIIGGVETFLDALLESIGAEGTLLIPYQYSPRGEPSRFQYPPLSLSLQEKWRENMPAFDKDRAYTYHMSIVSNALKSRKDAVLSNHPLYPFVLYGKRKEAYLGCNDLNYSLGNSSPLKEFYKYGKSLLVGVGYDNMTCLHLAEYLSRARPVIIEGAAVSENNIRIYKHFLDLELDSDDGFKEIGKLLEAGGLVNKQTIAKGEMKYIKASSAIDIAVKYFKERYAVYAR